ncbi:Cytoplasmic dynein 1 intermediate chain 1 [Acipenser ruthenus]|uniref:Cytoplasmic dynein 1 intermediate chain 1 n=1 Tax=Acipenser ruthenus TaxID=7906 RepID=A0A444UAP6_ACIRT|nr:Cytoplasmic dynein 1 intermediate chain 1 [Acipenser ruthenus]
MGHSGMPAAGRRTGHVQAVDPPDLQALDPLDVQALDPLDVQALDPLDVQALDPLDVQALDPLDLKQLNLPSACILQMNTPAPYNLKQAEKSCFVPMLQSSVMSVCFARFHPNLVVGGTYSGQIVLWDNRSHRRTPVQRTPLSAAAHTESMELVYNKSKPVAVTGMAFPTGDVNNYVVGSEEGTVYTACRHGSKAGIGEMFEGHQGPVTGISCHMAVGPIDFSHLFVTSSFDWTVKLWTTKHNKPLYSFEDNADYVYDVMWSPVHPALFACVDGMGRLDLWNLNNDTEVPTASVTIEGASALNRVRWAATGKEVAVGDSEGRVWIYDVGELAVPHAEDWTRFARTLVEIRANRADAEEEGAVELSN